MRGKFTKSDLKSGMAVKHRKGIIRLVVDNMLIGKDGFLSLDSFNTDLKNNTFSSNDIMKIYRIKEAKTFEYILKEDNIELIWERTETKHMTAEEMHNKLEELTGEKIEVEPSREEMVGTCYEFCNRTKCISNCILKHIGDCYFEKYPDEKLKQCYEKVMEDGRKES